MIYVDFCKGKSGLWIGCAEYNNGRYFATGRTLDILMKNIKGGGTKVFRTTASVFILSSKQMDVDEFEAKHIRFASRQFQSRFWYKTEPDTVTVTNRTGKKVIVDGIMYNSISEAERKLGIKDDTLGQALRHNKTKAVGHKIAYADEPKQVSMGEPMMPPIVSIPPIAPKPAEQEFICKEENGYMVIYQLKEIAKYKMAKGD